jgi:hypothetical protein
MREIDKGYAPQAERPGIGHLLERARQRQGVSLEEAERATRRCPSRSTCAGSSRHTPTSSASTETGTLPRSRSGRRDGGGHAGDPFGGVRS